MKLLRIRISDRRFRGLIARFLKAGILQQTGDLSVLDSGTAQGSIVSPVLANVYLHYCLDEWFIKNYSSKTRLYKKIRKFVFWIKKVRCRLKLNEIWEKTAAKLRGHYNYYGVHTNRPKLAHFYYAVVGSLFKWLNRRSQRKSFTWERFSRRLRFNPLPMPPQVTSLKPLIDRRVYAF